MDLTDLGAAVRIAFIYFTILYLTGLGGLFSERSGIVNIGLEGLMIIGTVSGAFGARFFTDTLGFADGVALGLVWGPILGLLFGALCGMIFAGVHAVATMTSVPISIVSGGLITMAGVAAIRWYAPGFWNYDAKDPVP